MASLVELLQKKQREAQRSEQCRRKEAWEEKWRTLFSQSDFESQMAQGQIVFEDPDTIARTLGIAGMGEDAVSEIRRCAFSFKPISEEQEKIIEQYEAAKKQVYDALEYLRGEGLSVDINEDDDSEDEGRITITWPKSELV